MEINQIDEQVNPCDQQYTHHHYRRHFFTPTSHLGGDVPRLIPTTESQQNHNQCRPHRLCHMIALLEALRLSYNPIPPSEKKTNNHQNKKSNELQTNQYLLCTCPDMNANNIHHGQS